MNTKSRLEKINENVLKVINGKSDSVRLVKSQTFLEVYSRFCNLDFNPSTTVKEVSKVSTLYEESGGITTRVINLELYSFRNEKEASRVYQFIDDKAKELRNTPRRSLGQFCVSPYELQIHYVFRSGCCLMVVNKQGNYSQSELETIQRILKAELEKF